MSAVPVEGDRERQRAIVRDWFERGHESGRLAYDELLDALAGVSLTGSGLREAAQAMADHMDGKHENGWEVCTSRSHLPTLRAALSGESGEPTR